MVRLLRSVENFSATSVQQLRPHLLEILNSRSPENTPKPLVIVFSGRGLKNIIVWRKKLDFVLISRHLYQN